MDTIEALVTRYIDTFNETDAAKRLVAIREIYTEDCGYTDPMASVTGPEGVDAFLDAVQKQFPGVIFSLAGKVDAHHDQVRFSWHAGPPGAAEPAVIGFDVAVLDRGRIRRVYGFLDKAPG